MRLVIVLYMICSLAHSGGVDGGGPPKQGASNIVLLDDYSQFILKDLKNFQIDNESIYDGFKFWGFQQKEQIHNIELYNGDVIVIDEEILNELKEHASRAHEIRIGE